MRPLALAGEYATSGLGPLPHPLPLRHSLLAGEEKISMSLAVADGASRRPARGIILPLVFVLCKVEVEGVAICVEG